MEDYIEKMMEQLNSGESKTIFKNISCIVIIGLTTSGRKPWQEEEETRKDTSIVVIRAINFHFIINSGLIPGGQNLSNSQTVFFLPVDPTDKNHKDPDTIDLNVPRHAQYMHKAWKKHQNTV